MTPILSLLIVLNAAWSTLPAEIVKLEETFAPLGLEVTYVQTKYENIRFTQYGSQKRIDDTYLDDVIIRLATSSDLVAFVLPPEQWESTDAGGYQHTGRPILTMEADEGSPWFQEVISHELSHYY